MSNLFGQKLPSPFFHRSEFAELTFCQNFLAGFVGLGVLYKEGSYWLDGVRTSNACIPHSLSGNEQTQLCSIPTPKSMFATTKKVANVGKIILYKKKKSEKVFGKLTLGNSKFAECEIRHFHLSDKLCTQDRHAPLSFSYFRGGFI